MRNLNKPERYNVASIQAQRTMGGDVMQVDENGYYVEFRDYKWLLDEYQRVTREQKLKAIPVEAQLIDRIIELKAEVERLRFAEDLLKDENKHLREEEPLPDGWNSSVAKACDILAEKDKEIARLQAEVTDLKSTADRLKAEVERLTALVESNLNSSKVAMGKADAVLHERDSLKAEVERLDNLVRFWSEKYQNENARFLRASERITAKEGKPSV